MIVLDIDNDHGEYSSTSTSENYCYGTDQSSTNNVEYRGFGYYHHGVDIAQLATPCYSNNGFSSQSFQPTGSNKYSYYYPYENYIPDFSTYHGDDYDDDFVPHRKFNVKMTILCMYL